MSAYTDFLSPDADEDDEGVDFLSPLLLMKRDISIGGWIII